MNKGHLSISIWDPGKVAFTVLYIANTPSKKDNLSIMKDTFLHVSQMLTLDVS